MLFFKSLPLSFSLTLHVCSGGLNRLNGEEYDDDGVVWITSQRAKRDAGRSPGQRANRETTEQLHNMLLLPLVHTAADQLRLDMHAGEVYDLMSPSCTGLPFSLGTRCLLDWTTTNTVKETWSAVVQCMLQICIPLDENINCAYVLSIKSFCCCSGKKKKQPWFMHAKGRNPSVTSWHFESARGV